MNKTKKRFEWDDYMAILEMLREKKKWDDLLFWTIAGHTGYRSAELMSLKWKDILGTDTILAKTTKTERFGKHKAYRRVWLSDRAIELINECVKNKYPINKDYYKELPLFRARMARSKSATMDPSGTNLRIRAWAKEMGIPNPENFSTNSLRKTFATRAFHAKGGDILALEAVRGLLGHSDTKTTLRYLGIDEDYKISIYKSL